MKEREIGELFKDKLSQCQVSPSDRCWQNIQQEVMNARKGRSAVGKYAKWLLPLLVVVPIMLYLLLSRPQPTLPTPPAQPLATATATPVAAVPAATPVLPTTSSSVPVAHHVTPVAVTSSPTAQTVLPPPHSPVSPPAPADTLPALVLPPTPPSDPQSAANAPAPAAAPITAPAPIQPTPAQLTNDQPLRYSTDTTICRNAQLTLFVENATEVQWSTGQYGNSITLYPEESLSLYAHVKRPDKSDTLIYFQVEVYDCNLFIPSAFTPNGDGLNDEFLVYAPMTISHYECVIFDKAGRILFKSQSIHQGWQGTFEGEYLPLGSYFYIIKYRDEMGDQHIQKGQVLLVR